jgi:hypothetical protein
MIPDGVKPAFRELKVDDDGRLWLWMYTQAVYEEREPSAPGGLVLEWREEIPVFEVLGTDGTFWGRISLPPGSYWHDARGDYVWVERAGEDGSPLVVRLRIQSNS